MSSLETHHKKGDVATSRPSYREARWERAVKVYTVNQESKYLLVQNVHALGVTEELMQLFSLYGSIQEYRLLDEYPCEPYTDVYWVKFTEIDAARLAKRKTDNHSFFGKNLHVCYAPEYETVSDTREKLQQRRKAIAAKTRGEKHLPGSQSVQPSGSTGPSLSTAAQTLSTEPVQITVPSAVLSPASSASSSRQGLGLLSLPTQLPAPPYLSSTPEHSYPSMTQERLTPLSVSAKAKEHAETQKASGVSHCEVQDASQGLSKDERLSLYLSNLDDPLQNEHWSKVKKKAQRTNQSSAPREQSQKSDGQKHRSQNPIQEATAVLHDPPMTGDKSMDMSITAIRKKMSQVQQPGGNGPITKKRRRI